MRHPAHDVDLAPEPLDDDGALAQVRVQDLERDLVPGLLVARAHHLRDRAAPHGRQHAIAVRQPGGQAGGERRDRHIPIFAQLRRPGRAFRPGGERRNLVK